MLFFKLLFFATILYFTKARPDDKSDSHQPSGTVDPNGSAIPESTNSSTTAIDDEKQMTSFMKDMTVAFDKNLGPMMSELCSGNQEELKIMGMNAIASYINSMMLMMHDCKNQGSEKFSTFDIDDIIVEFESLNYLPGTAFIAAQSASTVTEKQN